MNNRLNKVIDSLCKEDKDYATKTMKEYLKLSTVREIPLSLIPEGAMQILSIATIITNRAEIITMIGSTLKMKKRRIM
jgi:hypothetical protein